MQLQLLRGLSEYFEAISCYGLDASYEKYISIVFGLLLKTYFIFRARRTAAREN